MKHVVSCESSLHPQLYAQTSNNVAIQESGLVWFGLVESRFVRWFCWSFCEGDCSRALFRVSLFVWFLRGRWEGKVMKYSSYQVNH